MRGAAAEAAGIDRAAATLREARRVLVTGRGCLPATTALRACDLAEALGAAIDFGGDETAQVSGPTIARIGEVTADPGELRDRADLVVFWFCDPAADAPGFLRGWITPAIPAGRPRHTIAVGPFAVETSAAADRHLATAGAAAVDLARLVHAAVIGREVPAAPPALAAARDALVTALATAGCVAFVTRHRDRLGLEAWSLVGLVRAIAHRTPAFEVPLVAPGAARAACTWRYGAAGAIARADRAGGEFRPAECDATRLVDRREVDCVVAVGPLPADVERVIAARGDSVSVIRIPDDEPSARRRLDELLAAVGTPAPAGTVS